MPATTTAQILEMIDGSPATLFHHLHLEGGLHNEHTDALGTGHAMESNKGA